MNLQEQINELYKLIQKKNVETEINVTPKIVYNENIITYKQRWFWSAVIFIVTSLPFIYHYSIQSEWAAVSFGFFIVGLIIPILLFIDVKFTNGDSFDKISENGIALAISFLAMSILFIGCLQYGERFSPERINGEALQRIESQIGELQNRFNSNTDSSPKSNNENWDEGSTR